MTGPSAIDALTAAFDRRPADIDESGSLADRVVTSWPSVPVEVIRAAGLTPLVARASNAPTPTADRHLEAGVFPSRLRHLVEAALTGELDPVAAMVIPRTSDPDYKVFLYLHEFVRTTVVTSLPRTYLFDLLQSRTAGVPTYDRDRTQVLSDALGAITGRAVTAASLRREITRANTARAAVRRLLDLRRAAPRISGAEVLPLVGAFWQMDPDRYATLATAAAEALNPQPCLRGPRLLLAGAPVDGTALHTMIESRGGVVVAEASPWGSGAAGADVRLDDDPIGAIADKYRRDTIGARLPAADIRAWLDRATGDIDGVVVSLPPDDTVFGWDYPALHEALAARGVPHACVHGAPEAPATAADHHAVDVLVAAASHRRAVAGV